jgi:dihydroflavonol-4-reductase
MPACVNTGLNVVDVEDVARGHILAMEKGKIGERYLLGNRNLTLREIFRILEHLTGIKAPRMNIPIWSALAAAYVDEFFRGQVLKRQPRIPIAAVKAARRFRHFDCYKAVQELGLPQTPVEEAFEKAVKWFKQNGYVR